MNPIRKFAIKAAQTVIRNLTVREPDGWYASGQISDAGELVSGESALSLSAVWACANLIAGTGSTLPLGTYKGGNTGVREPAREHPLYRVINDSPNYDQTAVDFWSFMFASLELWGNAYARVERSAGQVRGLYPVAPHLVGVRRKQNGDIEYRWTDDGKSYVETDKSMLHIRGFGGNPLGGMSTLHFARHTFGLARAIERSAAGMFKNGMRPAGVLTFDKWLSQEQRDIAEKKLSEKFVGAVNSGKPMVLEGGTKWEQLTINPEDAQMLESRGFSVEEICRFFGVPPFMIGHTEKTTSWGTGLEQQTLAFQKFTLQPRLVRIERALDKQLLTAADRASGIVVKFNLEGLLRADSAGRAKFYQQMTSIGAMTINEVRAKENLPPVEGGDLPRMQMQNIPITETETGQVRQLLSQQD